MMPRTDTSPAAAQRKAHAGAPRPVLRPASQVSNTDHKVIQKRISHLRDACAFINDTVEDHKDDKAFHRIVEWAIQDCGIQPVALAEAFDSNTGTVSRWRTGKNAPHPRVRPLIIAWIKDTMIARANELEAELVRMLKEDEKEREGVGRQNGRKRVI